MNNLKSKPVLQFYFKYMQRNGIPLFRLSAIIEQLVEQGFLILIDNGERFHETEKMKNLKNKKQFFEILRGKYSGKNNLES